MMRKLTLLAATCLCFCAADKHQYRVEQVQVVFRHGDRIPDKSEVYETDPYDKTHWKPGGYGMLTDKGRKHAYQLGEVLRERYDGLVGRQFNEEEVFSYSTDFDRTQESLQMVLNGLFAPVHHKPWNQVKDLKKFPIRVKHRPNFMRPIKLYCKKYRTMYEAAENNPEIWKRTNQHEKFMDEVRERTKVPNLRTPKIASRLLGNLDAVISMGLPIPDWCTGDCYKILYELTGVHIDTYVLTEEMKRVVVGPAVKIFTNNIMLDQNSAKDDPKNKIKLFLFSGHDIGLSTISRVLRMKEVPEQPAYSSALIIEKLCDEEDKVYVRIYYYAGATAQIIPIKLEFPEKSSSSVLGMFKSKHCNLECPVKSYYKIVKPWLPHTDDEECESGSTSST